MAETNTVVHIGENSPEQIAYKLLERVASVEQKLMYATKQPGESQVADRKWILDTFSECLTAAKGNR